MEVRKVWAIPEESQFAYRGKDWLLIMIANLSKETRGLVLLFRRVWHLRNGVIHNKGEALIKDPVIFLQNMQLVSLCAT